MALSARLEAYLGIEREMRALDELGDPIADALRDALDPIWLSLSEDEIRFLDRRIIRPGMVYRIRLPLDEALYVALDDATAPRVAMTPVTLSDGDWAA